MSAATGCTVTAGGGGGGGGGGGIPPAPRNVAMHSVLTLGVLRRFVEATTHLPGTLNLDVTTLGESAWRPATAIRTERV